MTTLSEKGQIEMARLLTLRRALLLELKGMTRKGRPASALLRDMGYSGRTKNQVLESLENHLETLKKG